ncbi:MULTISPECIES: hypothetical protein [unclassified Acinetobacter]|jgi:hypothetical protein|nr:MULTISPECIES: hypothetical protein [unclassified Acinetobacter]MDD2944699.1 hypothetical protein [Acinetobacter sp.]
MTDSMLGLKILVTAAIGLLLGIAIMLWVKTPQLFEYFNQAFCAH